MPGALLLTVRFHDGRYHGRPEWPPAPARLFQALVAGAAAGKKIDAASLAALRWLEMLAPPVIVVPPARLGRTVTTFVPNNDLDAVGGDPKRVGEIRAGKLIRPRLFDARKGFLYVWRFEEGDDQAAAIVAIAKKLYQLGRGVDMAWAHGEVVGAGEAEARVAAHGGAVHRPSTGAGASGDPLACPAKGSLDSLVRRFAETGRRLTTVKRGRSVGQVFAQPPKARFRPVPYRSPPRRFVFDLRPDPATPREPDRSGDRFAPWPLTRAVALTEAARDAAVERMKEATKPDRRDLIDRVFVGRDAGEAEKAERIRITPLPSIGVEYVTRAIRRILVEVPPDCPLPAEDIAWAFSGLLVPDKATGEIKLQLVPAEESLMPAHYGVELLPDPDGEAAVGAGAAGRSKATGANSGGGPGGFRTWRTVTPVALPVSAGRRRIDPKALAAERSAAAAARTIAKSAGERLSEEAGAAAAFRQALRHAGVEARPEEIRVQREPFEGRGARAEAFAPDTRFSKERLWHVAATFDRPVEGPLVVGDGRYLGLGLFAPVKHARRDVLVLPVPPGVRVEDREAFLSAVRRALMALSRDGTGEVPRLFSGHEPDGAPAASGAHEHVFLSADDGDADGMIDRLMVAAPWAADLTPRKRERGDGDRFESVVSQLRSVRAGRLGVIELGPAAALPGGDPLAGPARVWESRTPYLATRHAGRRKNPEAAILRDAAEECARRGLPAPEIAVVEWASRPGGGGLSARLRLAFAVAVKGPLLLGRDSHRGGGVFAASA